MDRNEINGLDDDETKEERKYYLLSNTGVQIIIPRTMIEKWPVLSAYFLSNRWTVDDRGFQTYRTTEELSLFVSKETSILSIEEEFGGERKPITTISLLDIGEIRISLDNIGYYTVLGKEVTVSDERKNVPLSGGFHILLSENDWNSIRWESVPKTVIMYIFNESPHFREYILGKGEPGVVRPASILI